MYALQQILHDVAEKRDTIINGLRAAISVTGPSVRHILNVNLCVMCLAGFFISTWLLFFASTFAMVLVMAMFTPRELMAAGVFAGITFSAALFVHRKRNLLEQIGNKLIAAQKLIKRNSNCY